MKKFLILTLAHLLFASIVFAADFAPASMVITAPDQIRYDFDGSDITIPFVSGKLTLGTWQQVVFLEFDNKPRNRNVILQIMGE